MMADPFNFIAGLASIAGFAFGFYFYFQQKKTDEVIRGFFQAIKHQNQSVYDELKDASGIANTTGFDKLTTQVKAAKRSTETLTQTLAAFENTLWDKKGGLFNWASRPTAQSSGPPSASGERKP